MTAGRRRYDIGLLLQLGTRFTQRKLVFMRNGWTALAISGQSAERPNRTLRGTSPGVSGDHLSARL